MLQDPFSEFFISEAIGTPQDALWEHKYSIRPGMYGNFDIIWRGHFLVFSPRAE